MGSLPNLSHWWGLWSRCALSIFFSIWLILPKWWTNFTFGHFFHFLGQFWYFFGNNSRTKCHFALILVLKVAVTKYTTEIWKKNIFEKSIMAPQAAKNMPLKTKNSKFWNLVLQNSALLHQVMLKFNRKLLVLSDYTKLLIFCSFVLLFCSSASINATQFFKNLEICAILKLPFPSE